MIIVNQVFIGCPWRTVRPKYERAIERLNKKYPLSFIIVGRDGVQNADDLLKIITEKIFTSSHAIFDATGGNANVSLEFGLAEARDVPRSIYVSSHAASRKNQHEAPIISDLAGKRRSLYKQEGRLEKLLQDACKNHNYTKRFEKFLRKESSRKSKGQKKRFRALALKVVHSLDEKDEVRREDMIQALLGDQVGYAREEIDHIVSRLHKSGLIKSFKGRYSTIKIR